MDAIGASDSVFPPKGEGTALLIDLYELTMAASYFAEGMFEPATFSLFVRRMPQNRSYLVSAGLNDVVDFLRRFRFTPDDLGYLRSTGIFDERFLQHLASLRFRGDVWALPEGTVFFANEPVLEVTAPMIEAQLVETYLLNQIHYQSVITAKAARCVWAAQGKPVIDFSLRRDHGAEAGLRVARDSYLAGFQSTSNVLAGKIYGLPTVGTMAHSYVEAFPQEIESFRAYCRHYPDSATLLIDTYDTPVGAQKAAIVGRELERASHRLRAVRLDSGDMIALSVQVREILDQAGLAYVRIVASGGWDEYSIAKAVRERAPIDVFAVGTKLGVSADAPFSDMAYKLVEYSGRSVLKLSAGKATLPGAKQVYRTRDATGRFVGDTLALRSEKTGLKGEPLLVEVMRAGGVTGSRPTLIESREYLRRDIEDFDERYLKLEGSQPYPVGVSKDLQALQHEVQDRLRSDELGRR